MFARRRNRCAKRARLVQRPLVRALLDTMILALVTMRRHIPVDALHLCDVVQWYPSISLVARDFDGAPRFADDLLRDRTEHHTLDAG